MKPEDVCLRMPQPDLPIGNCSLDLSKPPPVTYHVDPVEIEEGRARERMSWEVIKPGNEKDTADSFKWVSGKFVKSENSKTEFTYSFEVGPHMLFCLSAKRIGEKFYISQYRDFPRSCEAYLKKEGKDKKEVQWTEPPSHYIAVLVPEPRQVATYKLCLTAHVSDPDAAPTVAKDIAVISQSTFKIKEATSAPIRAMKISIPPLVTLSGAAKDEDEEDEPDYQICQGMNEDMWARYSRNSLLSQTDMWSHHVKHNPWKKPEDPYRGPRIKLMNKTPFWNYEVGSLVVKFDRNRITMASSKNFIIFHEKDVNNREKSSSDAILQFGKVGKKTFTLDYKQPLCALQAFGVALSAFAWKGDDANK